MESDNLTGFPFVSSRRHTAAGPLWFTLPYLQHTPCIFRPRVSFAGWQGGWSQSQLAKWGINCLFPEHTISLHSNCFSLNCEWEDFDYFMKTYCHSDPPQYMLWNFSVHIQRATCKRQKKKNPSDSDIGSFANIAMVFFGPTQSQNPTGHADNNRQLHKETKISWNIQSQFRISPKAYT